MIENLKHQDISCLIAHPFQNGACILWEFRKIKDLFGIIPLVFVFRCSQLELFRKCAETTADEILDLDDIDHLPQLVHSVIARCNFQKQVLPNDWANLRHPLRVKKALKIIHSSFAKIKYAEEVSSQLGLSVETFRKEFRRFCGLSFHQYLLRLKLHYAAYLSKRTKGLPVREIARRCGYDNEAQFSHLFKRKTGVSFSEFIDNYSYQNFPQIYNHNSGKEVKN